MNYVTSISPFSSQASSTSESGNNRGENALEALKSLARLIGDIALTLLEAVIYGSCMYIAFSCAAVLACALYIYLPEVVNITGLITIGALAIATAKKLSKARLFILKETQKDAGQIAFYVKHAWNPGI